MNTIRYYWVTGALAATLLLAGCGEDSPTSTPNPSPEPPKAANTAVPPTAAPEATVKVALPAVSTAPLASPLNSPLQPSAGSVGDFAPKERGIWNTTIGPDTMTGDCKASVLPVYGMVQITPEGDTLGWKNQEPKPYTMTKIALNQYQYAGPSVVGDGTVTMTVTFIDDKNFEMTRDFVVDDVPSCNHHHDYAGVFQWNK